MDAGEHTAVAALIGTPACCAEFHHEQWVEHGVTDLTWPSARRAAAAVDGVVDLPAASLTNLLWRALGLRPVFHLPCAPDCASSERLGAAIRELAVTAGFATEMAWLDEILSWPVSWSALHGIAEILTPIGKISTNTDPTLDRHVVRRHGEAVPDEMVPGLAFPYDTGGRDALARPESVPVVLGSRR